MKLAIDEKRKERYKSKIAHSRERLLDMEEWINDKEEKDILASEKAYQEAIEAIMDVFAMLLADIKLEVSDDYSNIEKVEKRSIINKEEAELCKKANGLRNAVIHKYNGIDTEAFIENSKTFVPLLNKILDKLDTFIKNV